MESILSNEKECFVCGTTQNLHKHHIYHAANRNNSEKWGCWCYLCMEHHTGNTGVHMNKAFQDQLQEVTQLAFEKKFPNEDFVKIFGKNYI